jgi:hypothetical protein
VKSAIGIGYYEPPKLKCKLYYKFRGFWLFHSNYRSRVFATRVEK